MKIAVLGAGAWGTALAISLSGRHDVTLWARDAAQVAGMRETRRNRRYLPDIALPDNLQLSDDLQAVLMRANLIVVAVPVSGLRVTLQQISELQEPVGVIWLCKGFETETSLLPHQIVNEILPAAFPRGALTGPSFAQEVARGLPTALTLASSDGDFAQRTARALHHSRLR
ncbi:MAG: NAD(P)H-dependent glycerol-3-phosphate dehydrogenase, partial [Sideroxydans sp.]|nr:NAD(P)H-dependent glycerol-3-phosphate dehydrogenase [Sideroxydans sp.]